MADTKITALAAITTVDPAADVLPIVDVSDTSMAASGTTKKITSNQILGAGGTATLASATITGAATAANLVVTGSTIPANGVYLPSANNLGFAYNSTLGMTLNATGLGVGLAASAGKLEVLNNTDTLSNIAAFSNSSRFRAISLLSGASTASRNYYFVAGASLGADQLEIRSSGYASKDPSAATKILSLDQNGYLTLTSGDLIMGTSGRGIDFSATPSGSGTMTSELLNDYEEGTWTGTIGGTTGNPTTPVTSTGRYTKIGRQVSVEIGFYGDTTGASSRITVSGLPFTSNASISRPGAILMDTIGTFTGSPIAFLGSGVTTIELYSSNSNGAISSVTHNAGAGRALYMELTYTV